jgi:hypothetical protein
VSTPSAKQQGKPLGEARVIGAISHGLLQDGDGFLGPVLGDAQLRMRVAQGGLEGASEMARSIRSTASSYRVAEDGESLFRLAGEAIGQGRCEVTSKSIRHRGGPSNRLGART